MNRDLMKKIALVIGVVFVLIVILSSGSTDLRNFFARRGKVVQTTPASNATRSKCPNVTDNPAAGAPVVLTFQLVWDQNVGEFLVDLEIGGSSVRAVPDTGSEYIVVGTPACANCDPSQGFFDTESSTAVKTSGSRTVQYGSQTDNLDWYIDDFSTGGGSTVRIEFAGVTSVQSAEGVNMNVFGLASSTSYTEKTPFIDQLVCTQQVALAYMYFDFVAADPVFALGQPHPNANSGSVVNYFDAADIQADGIDLAGYFLRPKEFTIDGVAVSHMPAYCMFDTGTTLFTVSSALASLLLAKEGRTVLLTFDTFQIPFLITASMMDTTDAFGDDICIFGNQLMLDHAWSFDIGAKTLTVI